MDIRCAQCAPYCFCLHGQLGPYDLLQEAEKGLCCFLLLSVLKNIAPLRTEKASQERNDKEEN